MNLTPRQTDVVVAIRNYRHLHGYAPTMQELADQLGTSKVTIFEHVGALEKMIPLGRTGTPEDIAGMAVALQCDRFSAYVTGTTVVVDGGIALYNWIPAAQ